MDKPLKDWTLGELKEYCTGRNCVANECRLNIGGDGFRNCKVRGVPSRWDLSDPSRWTAEDIADAKAIKRLFPYVDKVYRTTDRAVIAEGGGEYHYLSAGSCPTLQMGEIVTLQEILDAEGKANDDTSPDRHGYWYLLDECSNEGVYCSECYKKVYRKEYANQKVKSPFCPNCGAKMDLRQEDGENT